MVAFLEKESSEAYQGYLEHIINVLGEDEADFHDKLAEIYLAQAKAAKKRGESQCSHRSSMQLLMNRRPRLSETAGIPGQVYVVSSISTDIAHQ